MENGHSEIDSNELRTKFTASQLSFTLPSSLEDVFTVKHGLTSIDSPLPAVLLATVVSHSGVDNTEVEQTVTSPTDSSLQHTDTKPQGDSQNIQQTVASNKESQNPGETNSQNIQQTVALQHTVTKPQGDKQSEHAPGLPPHHHQGKDFGITSQVSEEHITLLFERNAV